MSICDSLYVESLFGLCITHVAMSDPLQVRRNVHNPRDESRRCPRDPKYENRSCFEDYGGDCSTFSKIDIGDYILCR